METLRQWGPIQWDGTFGGIYKCLKRFEDAGVPSSATLVIGNVSYGGAQVSARVEEHVEA